MARPEPRRDLKIGDRVIIRDHSDFNGCTGKIFDLCEGVIAVDLDEGGWWFTSSESDLQPYPTDEEFEAAKKRSLEKYGEAYRRLAE